MIEETMILGPVGPEETGIKPSRESVAAFSRLPHLEQQDRLRRHEWMDQLLRQPRRETRSLCPTQIMSSPIFVSSTAAIEKFYRPSPACLLWP